MKELIVILAIAGLTFLLAKPIALRFSADADFLRRRNVWFALTIIAFLSPNFWIFALFAVPIYIWIGRKDSNPTAAYLLLMHVVPPVSLNLPAIGASQLFSLNNYRLLSFCLLIPIALRARRSLPRDRASRSRTTDLLLLAFIIVQCARYVPPDLPNHVILQDSLTNLLRRVFLGFADILVLYYAVSRSCNDRNKIVDAQAAFCLSSGIMAVVATFEHFKGWLLYTQLAAHWDPTDATYTLSWLLRGDTWLRAQASSGHSLSLGVMLAIAFGFWLYLQARSTTLRSRLTIGVLFWLGMIATFSRGPWIGAMLIYLAYSALKPRAISRLFKAAFLMAVVLGLISLSPIGEKIMTSLHVTGGQPDADFIYRQRLLDRTLELVQAHPLFGDPLAMQEMEDLRQGQGIIDIVNTYIGVLLFNGWVGLVLFLGFALSALKGVVKTAKAAISSDPDGALLGFNIAASIIGILFLIADCSLMFGVEKMFYILVGLGAAYARQGNQATSPVSTTSAERRNELRPLTGA
jgi:O-Antigen ligase